MEALLQIPKSKRILVHSTARSKCTPECERFGWLSVPEGESVCEAVPFNVLDPSLLSVMCIDEEEGTSPFGAERENSVSAKPANAITSSTVSELGQQRVMTERTRSNASRPFAIQKKPPPLLRFAPWQNSNETISATTETTRANIEALVEHSEFGAQHSASVVCIQSRSMGKKFRMPPKLYREPLGQDDVTSLVSDGKIEQAPILLLPIPRHTGRSFLTYTTCFASQINIAFAESVGGRNDHPGPCDRHSCLFFSFALRWSHFLWMAPNDPLYIPGGTEDPSGASGPGGDGSEVQSSSSIEEVPGGNIIGCRIKGDPSRRVWRSNNRNMFPAVRACAKSDTREICPRNSWRQPNSSTAVEAPTQHVTLEEVVVLLVANRGELG
mmetsp:Transcript_21326/g.39701  ORF Transcript_21326/g.39701 Transcript_21326/m.39701 type:complete len:383 (-) Transcript_21326:1804-2952(-)